MDDMDVVQYKTLGCCKCNSKQDTMIYKLLPLEFATSHSNVLL